MRRLRRIPVTAYLPNALDGRALTARHYFDGPMLDSPVKSPLQCPKRDAKLPGQLALSRPQLLPWLQRFNPPRNRSASIDVGDGLDGARFDVLV